jgi:hypothetical protein
VKSRNIIDAYLKLELTRQQLNILYEDLDDYKNNERTEMVDLIGVKNLTLLCTKLREN